MVNTALLHTGRHFVEVNGIRLCYEVRGSGPLLIWHPGGPGMAIQGYPGYEVMADSFQVVYLDPRGAGASQRLVDTPTLRFQEMSTLEIAGTEAYALERYSDDLLALADLWGLDRLNLAGHSHGGFVAFDFATRYPHRVDKLILVGTSGVMDVADPRYEERRKPKMDTESYQRYLRVYQAKQETGLTPLDWYRDGLMLQFTIDIHDFDRHEQVLRDHVLTGSDAWLSFVPAYHFETHDIHRYDMRPRYADITADVLFIQGRQERLFLPEDIEEAVRDIPSAKVEWIEECAHMPMTEQPERLMKALRAFIGS